MVACSFCEKVVPEGRFWFGAMSRRAHICGECIELSVSASLCVAGRTDPAPEHPKLGALREREVTSLESIAKSLEAFAKSADLLHRLATNRS